MTHDIGAVNGFDAPPPAFDLTSEPWLPVQLVDGTEKELSLREVFEHAGEIFRLAGDLPTQDFALLRLLLAVCHDALDGPDNTSAWSALWQNKRSFAPIPAYLDSHQQRFDLLSASHPFLQTPGLHTAKDEISPLERVVADAPNGAPFYTMRFPGVERLSFAEAARWVVHAHAYDISGIKTGVVGDGRVKGGRAYPLGVGAAGGLGGVLAEGRNLRETLLLNLVATDFLGLDDGDDVDDAPAWRRPVSKPGEDPARKINPLPTGVRDLYTWQTRRILLHPVADGIDGVVLTYGDPLVFRDVRKYEPMTAWRRSLAQEKKLSSKAPIYLPREHIPARSAWRGLNALISPLEAVGSDRGEPAALLRPRIIDWVARLCNEGKLPKGMLIRVQTYGMVYGTQQSVVDEVVEDHLDMRVVLLDEARQDLGQVAVAAVVDAEAAVGAVSALASDLALAAVHNDKRRVQGDDKTTGEIARDAAADRAYAELDHHFRRWLSDIGEGQEPQTLRADWQRTVRHEIARLGREVLEFAGEAAWNGRVVEGAKGKAVWRNTALAERRFWFSLRRALPLAFDSSSQEGTDPDEPEIQDNEQEVTEE